MDLSIIIVNYNGKKDLLRCLGSLEAVRAERPFEVIVVDNGSTDGSLEDGQARFGWVRFLSAGGNLGFARGCNLGLEQAKGRHAMLLNPDTEVLSGSLCRLVDTLEQHPTWGVVGPTMVDPFDQPYLAARRFPTPYYLFCECTRLAYLFPHTRQFAGYFYGDVDPATLDAVDQVEGSALLISRDAWQAVGNLDPRFFLFFEEVDWCKRVRNASFEIHLVKDAKIRHHRATTMSRFYVKAREANARSAMQYFEKHNGAAGLKSVRRWMRMALTIRIIAATVAGWLGKGELARLRVEGARAERRVYRNGMSA